MNEATPSPAADGEPTVVEETGLGRFQVEARTGAAAILVDEPVSAGGLGTGPNPFDLLCAALGSCTAMTVRLYAERKSWPLKHVRVRVTHHRGTLHARDSFHREITLDGALDETQRTRLMEIAEHCPVHLTLERGADISSSLTPPPADLGGAGAPGEHMKTMEEACAR
ncbi:MAG: OsmC family protein [Phenylobacterium sp.]